MTNSYLFFSENGFLQESGGYEQVLGYESYNIPNLDVSLDDPFIYTKTGFADLPQKINYDYFSGDGDLFFVPSGVSPSSIFQNSHYAFSKYFHIFRNEKFLFSGYDYIISSSGFVFLRGADYSGDASFFIKQAPLFIEYSDILSNHTSSFLIDSSGFNNYTSRVYLDGRRLFINKDYVENSTNDLLSGKFRTPLVSNLL
jgi:hypothetical protein